MGAYAAYRVLMVEDDRGIAQAVQTQGELWNLQVRQVRDLRHVMEEFAEFDPHLVLLDIGLPCFDGYHWCTEIRRVSRVPVIFISSAADNMNIIMAMNLGADDFITKPSIKACSWPRSRPCCAGPMTSARRPRCWSIAARC